MAEIKDQIMNGGVLYSQSGKVMGATWPQTVELQRIRP